MCVLSLNPDLGLNSCTNTHTHPITHPSTHTHSPAINEQTTWLYLLAVASSSLQQFLKRRVPRCWCTFRQEFWLLVSQSVNWLEQFKSLAMDERAAMFISNKNYFLWIIAYPQTIDLNLPSLFT